MTSRKRWELRRLYKDGRTGGKLEVPETRMKGQTEKLSCGDQAERTGRKLEVLESRMKGQTEK
jgi:hypothetical protein